MFGFQRLVWWPKWTPASSSSLMPASAIYSSFLGDAPPLRCAGPGFRRAGPAWRGGVGGWCRGSVGNRASAARTGEGCRQVLGQLRGELQPRAGLRMRQGEAVRVQELPPEAETVVAPVLRVARQRVADRREVGADLVRAAGLQPRLHIGLTWKLL